VSLQGCLFLSLAETRAFCNLAASQHLQVMRSKDMPGAGQYNTYRAVGKQPLSSKKTLPAHSFGKSTRDASKKVTTEVWQQCCACLHI
jgi:DNA polymerase III psi subunit